MICKDSLNANYLSVMFRWFSYLLYIVFYKSFNIVISDTFFSLQNRILL